MGSMQSSLPKISLREVTEMNSTYSFASITFRPAGIRLDALEVQVDVSEGDRDMHFEF